MSTGERITKLREQREWNQRELARRAGLNYSVMNRIESGKRPLTDDEVRIFADLFDVSADYLLGRSTKSSTSATNNNIIDTLTEKDEKDIAKRMSKIQEDLSKDDGYMLMGEPMSEEAKESILDAMEYAIRQAKRINKKYIPKKYRDNQE